MQCNITFLLVTSHIYGFVHALLCEQIDDTILIYIENANIFALELPYKMKLEFTFMATKNKRPCYKPLNWYIVFYLFCMQK